MKLKIFASFNQNTNFIFSEKSTVAVFITEIEIPSKSWKQL